ncbi:hypothetical protein GCM10011289_27990 [Paludibacterium paludis]|uniref:Transmembrane protein n=1 Tax=Paludibacterium paludis TaxID=1225769 RepID=A0A918P5D2_9NEIS|nr:hypothetical protein GCM10011289_27990 [Paludibacterium paludis]
MKQRTARQGRNGARWLRRALRFPFLLVVALVILFEEFAWDELAALAARFARWRPVAALEKRIMALPPLAALAVFLVPGVLLLPVKLAAVWLIAAEHVLTGLTVIVLAKVAGTALVARIFSLTRPQLMTVRWFAAIHDRVVAFKRSLHETLRAMAVWRAAVAWLRRLRASRRSGGMSRFVRRRLEHWRRS